jgi:hypothetical protein
MFKKIFKSIKNLLSRIFKGNKKLQENTDKVIVLVDKIKFYLNNPAVDIIIAATPTTEDDKIVLELRTILERAAKELGIVADGVVYENPEQLLILIRDYLQKLTVVAQKGALQTIAVILLKLLENEISTTEANLIVASAYYEKKNAILATE